MSLDQSYLTHIEERLALISPSLVDTLHEALKALPETVPEERTRAWLEEGAGLAEQSPRSWEACGEYFKAGPRALPLLSDDGFEQWTTAGRALTELAAPMAATYYHATPEVVPLLGSAQVRDWAHIGRRLYRATWKSITLASEYYRLSPQLLAGFSVAELSRLGRVLEGVSDRSADLAAACLDAAPKLVMELDHPLRLAFIDFAGAISDASWPEASLYFQRGPDLIRGIDASQRARYLELATGVARRLPRTDHRAGVATGAALARGGDVDGALRAHAQLPSASARDRGLARRR